ncbi:sulfotransferase domain-containing protein [Rhizobium mayense]|uniref:Sulfotransferase domain-containing protein n=1 Tax=Rhizobium mayense TaxID=1312184 RepID=A0ABT7K4W8_9HYPH|nr:sulfotransferase domain-containing protein [Rhizobium mayense]MDL2403660.1 sulfotransferase domain-containing protein [Rhizobium mayense]
MTIAAANFPRKTRDIMNHHLDSTIWDEFVFRNDDIVVATYAKSGTTWTQQIIAQLLFDGAQNIDVMDIAPWLDMRILPRNETLAKMEAQTHRRVVKTHLPVDALVFSPKAKYVYVARDGRDVLWSFYNHHVNFNETYYKAVNDTPNRVGPPISRPNPNIHDYFLEWLMRDGYPFWSYWDNVRSWWKIRNLPNVLMLHYANLKTDMEGQMRRIAEFLDIPINEQRWPTIMEQCTFAYMKANASRDLPLPEAMLEGGADAFIYKGTNGRWAEVLTKDDVRLYETIAERQLGSDCAEWLATGRLPAGEQRGRNNPDC